MRSYPALLPAMLMLTSLALPAAVAAQTPGADADSWLDSGHEQRFDADRRMIDEALRAARGGKDPVRLLDEIGFRVTAINARSNDWHEYEVVRDDASYEIHIDFGGTDRPETVQVRPNMWRADTTEQALRDPTFRPAPIYSEALGRRHRDALFVEAWKAERARLAGLLVSGQPRGEYRRALEAQGYRITAEQDAPAGPVAMEIVKDADTFEVILARGENGAVGDVEVTANLWRAPATQQALEQE